MNRNDCSYWLRVNETTRRLSDDERDAIKADVETTLRLAFDGEGLHDPRDMTFAVPDDVGTYEQRLDVFDDLVALSTRHPDANFSLREVGETNQAHQRAMRVQNGEVTFDNVARLVEATVHYDDLTVKAVVDAIRDDFHQTELANFIAARFRNTPWQY